ncbi:hypothetical protein [Microbacterium mangrovi]|uniref:hypothetical protein n=1 Tax=Microbacterium mangrovi TaxID=1348253 RepID=UPI0038B2C0B0
MNPGDGALRNNAAFAAAQLGRLDEAEQYLAGIGLLDNPDEAHTVEATRGLIAFRRGDVEAGRRLYGRARDGFVESKSAQQAVMAVLHWALEEVRISPQSLLALLEPARESVQRYPSAEGTLLLQRLESRRPA